ncbi:MAG: hypothetical protein GXO77_11915 [Calditrichaeota bacterium]|nr:hypothetical protein [Calditrichota bacterium]
MRHFNRHSLLLLFVGSLFIVFSCSTETPLSTSETTPSQPNQKILQTSNGRCYEGELKTGALYKICVPEEWNGELVVFAHGYVDPTQPVAIPESQLTLSDGTYIPDMITDMGYAFATTSYRANGFVVQEGIIDLVELVFLFKKMFQEPEHTYLVGASEGGLITVKSLEMKKIYSGGLALCGPIGDFTRQVNYVGDFRVLFDYFFPGVLPGSPINIPEELIANWDEVYVPKILSAISTYPDRAEQLIRCAKAPVDPNDPSTIARTVLGVLWYNVFATNDLVARVGGNPFDNTDRRYRGSANDAYLNKNVKRYSADAQALDNVHRMFDTTGDLNVPVLTMHTVGDQIVPAWHERLYRQKVFPEHGRIYYDNIFVMRYGHCNFTKEELLDGFEKMVLKVKAFEMLKLPEPTLAAQ